MQPARIKPHAKEHTNNPVQKPNFRGHAAGLVEIRNKPRSPQKPRLLGGKWVLQGGAAFPKEPCNF